MMNDESSRVGCVYVCEGEEVESEQMAGSVVRRGNIILIVESMIDWQRNFCLSNNGTELISCFCISYL